MQKVTEEESHPTATLLSDHCHEEDGQCTATSYRATDTCVATDSWKVSVTDPPNLKLLMMFPEMKSTTEVVHVNLFKEIGTNSGAFGVALLDDKTGSAVQNILHAKNEPEVTNREIVHKWLVGDGLKLVTWYTLMTVLEQIRLRRLADMIRDSVSQCAMNMSSEGIHYSLETLEIIETLKKVYDGEDLFDPDLWLSQHLPNLSYIPLTLEENGRETNMYELLRDLESESGKRILLTGRPGVGKTTLLRYASKLWARAGSKFLRVCQILVKIPLGSVGVPIPSDITQLMKAALGGDMEIDKLARDLLLNNGRGACLLLDAYDELKTDNAKRFIKDLLANGRRELHLPEALYVISSRSVSSSELTSHTTRTIEVVGINETNLQHFIKSLPHNKRKSLNGFFERQPNAQHLCHVPLYLSMIVYVVLADDDDVIHFPIDTETDLYTSFVNLTLEQYRKTRHPDWNRFSLWKCSFSEESTEKQCEGFRALCSAAFQSVFRFRVSVQLDIAQGVLDILQTDQDFELDRYIIESAREDLELLVEIAKDKDESRDVIRFSFEEKSYEEFVQALHLAGLPEEQDTLSLHNLVGKGSVMEEHVCTGYTVICLALNRLMEQGTDGPPINIIETLQERSLDGRTFGYEPVITNTLEDLSLAKITRRHSNYGEVLQFTFPHKTFQEFLCALYMTSLPQDEQLAYVAMYAKEDTFDLVFQFLFGLLRNSDSNVSKLLERYSAFKSADHRNTVLKLARETKLEGNRFKNLVQESGILVDSSMCIQVKERDDCLSMRYALKHTPVQKLGLHLTLFKKICYYTVHDVTDVHLTVNCPSNIASYNHLKNQLSPLEKVLTHLSVKRCLLTPDDVLAFAKQLKRLTGLQTLHLVVTTDVTVEGAEALSTALQSLPRLKALQLDMEIMCMGTQVLINSLQHLKFLRHLSLTLRSTDEKTLEDISYKRQHSCWKYGKDLHCPYQPFIDWVCCVHNLNRHLQHRGSTYKLATIFLSGNCSDNVHTPVKHSFEALGRLENLETLILAISLDQHSEVAALFSVQGQLSNLKSLDLSYNYIFDDSYDYTFINLKLSKLQFLDIGHTSWKLDNLIELFAFSSNLQTIKFTDSRTHTDVAVESLQLLQHLQHLEAVILDFSDVNDTHVPTLSKYISNMPSLRVLDLGCNKITTFGLNMLISALHRLEYFHHLDLSYNQITTVDIASTLYSLCYLSLAGNGMGAEGALSLAAALEHLPSVEHLDLSKNELTCDGVVALVHELHLLHRLQYLDLSYNQLKFDMNQVEEIVEGLAKIATLKYLSLAGNTIPPDSAKLFANRLTQLRHLDLSDIANQLSLQ